MLHAIKALNQQHSYFVYKLTAIFYFLLCMRLFTAHNFQKNAHIFNTECVYYIFFQFPQPEFLFNCILSAAKTYSGKSINHLAISLIFLHTWLPSWCCRLPTFVPAVIAAQLWHGPHYQSPSTIPYSNTANGSGNDSDSDSKRWRRRRQRQQH